MVELISLNPAADPRELPRNDLAWMARILWASQ
jgi:phage repressor protein C with HTH and peptisase S24 domain